MKNRQTHRASALLQGVSGASVALFLARVALETTRQSWPGILVVSVGLLAALVGFAIGRRLAPRARLLVIGHWPLIIYIFWPRRDPLVAASVALLAALIWLLSGERTSLPSWMEPLADGLAFAVALAAYVVTAAPDVLPADAGEFQMVAALLGVAHPPGFPLYTMMGHLFVRLLPLGTPAYRLNLMSGLLAAATLVLVARATRLWARHLGASSLVAVVGGLSAALTLGSATTFWAQATIASKRPLTALLVALAFYALAHFAAADRRHGFERGLALLGLVLGLGFGNDSLGFVPILSVALYVPLVDPRLVVQPRRWWRPLLAGLAGLLPLLYLPIRGAAEGLNTLPGFLHHFLARGFGGDMFAFANAADLPHRLALIPTLFPFQFNVVLLAGALLSLVGLIWRDWRLFALLTGSLTLHTFVSITYRAPQTVEYLMPAYLPIAIAVGLLPSLLSPPHSHASRLVCAAVLCAALLNGRSHAPSFVELARDHTARDTVEPLLKTAPADALILADWRWATSLWYLQQVEELRPDVEVRYVYPDPAGGRVYWEVWEQHVRDADPGQAVLLTHFYEFSGYTTEPWETGFLMRRRPVSEPAAPLVSVETAFGDRVRVLGYGLRQDQFHAGQVVAFTLAWQAVGSLDPQPSLTLRLIDEEGRGWAQADQALSTDVAPGEVRFEQLTLALYPNLPPGRYRVTLGAYAATDAGFEAISTDNGADAITLTDLELMPRGCNLQSAICDPQSAPLTRHRQSVPFADGPTLVGVDYDRSVPDVLRVYLHWRGPGQGALQARVWSTGGVEAAAPLPPIPARAYQTIVMDLQAFEGGALQLALADGQSRVKQAAGPWSWPVEEIRLPDPAPDARFVLLGDEVALVGVRAHSAAPGETMALDVTLVALRPLTSDDSTSVRLTGADGRWLALHDIQPALGAVPTLKWIRGSRVVDRHLLPIPEDFTGTEVRATLVAYERFRLTRLHPMDSRFDEVPLGAWALP
jgi:hypothetical protein